MQFWLISPLHILHKVTVLPNWKYKIREKNKTNKQTQTPSRISCAWKTYRKEIAEAIAWNERKQTVTFTNKSNRRIAVHLYLRRQLIKIHIQVKCQVLMCAKWLNAHWSKVIKIHQRRIVYDRNQQYHPLSHQSASNQRIEFGINTNNHKM